MPKNKFTLRTQVVLSLIPHCQFNVSFSARNAPGIETFRLTIPSELYADLTNDEKKELVTTSVFSVVDMIKVGDESLDQVVFHYVYKGIERAEARVELLE